MVSFDAAAFFTFIDPKLEKQSRTSVLHNTPNLAKFSKFEISRIMDFINSVSLPNFNLMEKYTNKSEEHPWDHHCQES